MSSNPEKTSPLNYILPVALAIAMATMGIYQWLINHYLSGTAVLSTCMVSGDSQPQCGISAKYYFTTPSGVVLRNAFLDFSNISDASRLDIPQCTCNSSNIACDPYDDSADNTFCKGNCCGSAICEHVPNPADKVMGCFFEGFFSGMNKTSLFPVYIKTNDNRRVANIEEIAGVKLNLDFYWAGSGQNALNLRDITFTLEDHSYLGGDGKMHTIKVWKADFWGFVE